MDSSCVVKRGKAQNKAKNCELFGQNFWVVIRDVLLLDVQYMRGTVCNSVYLTTCDMNHSALQWLSS